jgi:hypothetical protein
MGGGTASLRWLATFAGIAPLAAPAFAGAWSQKAGEQQFIATLSRETGDFDEAWRTSDHAEYGFGGGWAANLKAEGELRFGDTTEDRWGVALGAKKAFAIGDRASFSVQASLLGGESIDGPDCQGSGYETRAALGTSFAIGGREGFVNIEGAAKTREDCSRQLIELTTGIEVAPHLNLIVKGWSEDGTFAHSEKIEPSLLYSFGNTTIGVGWRQEVSGEFEEKGWVVQAWRKF